MVTITLTEDEAAHISDALRRQRFTATQVEKILRVRSILAKLAPATAPAPLFHAEQDRDERPSM